MTTIEQVEPKDIPEFLNTTFKENEESYLNSLDYFGKTLIAEKELGNEIVQANANYFSKSANTSILNSEDVVRQVDENSIDKIWFPAKQESKEHEMYVFCSDENDNLAVYKGLVDVEEGVFLQFEKQFVASSANRPSKPDDNDHSWDFIFLRTREYFVNEEGEIGEVLFYQFSGDGEYFRMRIVGSVWDESGNLLDTVNSAEYNESLWERIRATVRTADSQKCTAATRNYCSAAFFKNLANLDLRDVEDSALLGGYAGYINGSWSTNVTEVANLANITDNSTGFMENIIGNTNKTYAGYEFLERDRGDDEIRTGYVEFIEESTSFNEVTVLDGNGDNDRGGVTHVHPFDMYVYENRDSNSEQRRVYLEGQQLSSSSTSSDSGTSVTTQTDFDGLFFRYTDALNKKAKATATGSSGVNFFGGLTHVSSNAYTVWNDELKRVAVVDDKVILQFGAVTELTFDVDVSGGDMYFVTGLFSQDVDWDSQLFYKDNFEVSFKLDGHWGNSVNYLVVIPISLDVNDLNEENVLPTS